MTGTGLNDMIKSYLMLYRPYIENEKSQTLALSSGSSSGGTFSIDRKIVK